MNLMSFPARMAGLGLAMALAGGAAAVATNEKNSHLPAHSSPAPAHSSPAPEVSSPSPEPSQVVYVSPLQNHSLTPGQYYSDTNLSEICAAPDDNVISKLPLSTAHAIFDEYNIPFPQGSAAETWVIDHLIPTALGGTDDPTNLWPMKVPLASQKNELEAKLHDLVCDGQLQVAVAQQEIGLDWQSAYAKYLGHKPVVD